MTAAAAGERSAESRGAGRIARLRRLVGLLAIVLTLPWGAYLGAHPVTVAAQGIAVAGPDAPGPATAGPADQGPRPETASQKGLRPAKTSQKGLRPGDASRPRLLPAPRPCRAAGLPGAGCGPDLALDAAAAAAPRAAPRSGHARPGRAPWPRARAPQPPRAPPRAI